MEATLIRTEYDNKTSVLLLCLGISEQKAFEDARKKIEFIVCSKNFMPLVNRDYVYETVNKAYYQTMGPAPSRSCILAS